MGWVYFKPDKTNKFYFSKEVGRLYRHHYYANLYFVNDTKHYSQRYLEKHCLPVKLSNKKLEFKFQKYVTGYLIDLELCIKS